MVKGALPISVIVLTYNEESNIEECLMSVCGLTEEIFVVDSFSRDTTLEIVKRYTSNIYQHPFENYSKQRNWAQDNLPIKTEWIFHLDADERVTPELMLELKEIFSRNSINVDGFLVSRKTVFIGKWIKHGGHYPAYHLRIFKKDLGRCEDRLYDQHFIVDGNTLKLNSDIVDTITSDFSAWIERQRAWAVLEAQEICSQKSGVQVCARMSKNPIERKRWLRKKYYEWPLFVRPVIYFIYRYFIRFGFLDGKEGLIFHFVQGFWYRLLVDKEIHKIKMQARGAHKNYKTR